MTEKELREIEELIAQVEQHEMIQAPKHMKADILDKCARAPIPMTPRLRFLVYAAKVGTGMAAALLLLFSMNFQQETAIPKVPKESVRTEKTVAEKINDRVNDISSLIHSFSNSLIYDGGNSDDK